MNGIESYRSPSRKPWLFLVILAIVGLVVWLGLRTPAERPPREPRPTRAEPSPRSVDVQPPPTERSAPEAASVRLPLPLVAPSSVSAEERIRLRDLLMRARQMGAEGDEGALRARDLLADALNGTWAPESIYRIEDELSAINMGLVFGPARIPEKEMHDVRRGEVISVLARRFGTTVEMTGIVNKLSDPNRIRIGQELLFMTGQFELVVRRERHELLVYRDGRFLLKFPVGLGEDDKTPVGTFRISDRIERPPWTSPGGIEYPYGHPENILGTHWMRILATGDTPRYTGLGIHGTTQDASIGRSESAGCVRMFNRDVARLFALVPVGTPVRIVDR